MKSEIQQYEDLKSRNTSLEAIKTNISRIYTEKFNNLQEQNRATVNSINNFDKFATDKISGSWYVRTAAESLSVIKSQLIIPMAK